MRPSDADISRFNRYMGLGLGLLHSLLERQDRRVQVDDNTFAPSPGLRLSEARDLQFPFLARPANQRSRHVAAEVQPGHVICFLRHRLGD